MTPAAQPAAVRRPPDRHDHNQEDPVTTPEIHTFTVETTGDGPSSVASGRLPNPIQTFTVDPAAAFGAANAGSPVPVQKLAFGAELPVDHAKEAARRESEAQTVIYGISVNEWDRLWKLIQEIHDRIVPPTDPEAMREAASRLLTAANEAEASR